MSKVLLDLGFIQISWYSICIFIGSFLGLLYINHEVKRLHMDIEIISDIVFNSIILGIIGARIYFVIFNLHYYLSRPVEIFEIWNGGLAIHGGLILGFIYIVYVCRKREINLFRLLDIIVPALLIGQIVGRWGNFFNQEVYGFVVSSDSLNYLPLFIKERLFIDGSYRAPLFLYESLSNLMCLLGVLILRKQALLRNGYITSLYLIFYGLIRFVIEGMRDPEYNLMLGSFKIAQIISIIFIGLGIFVYIYNKKGRRLENLYNKGLVIINENE